MILLIRLGILITAIIYVTTMNMNILTLLTLLPSVIIRISCFLLFLLIATNLYFSIRISY